MLREWKRTTTLPAQPAYRTIFVTSGTIEGDDGLVSTDGVANLDNLCQTEADSKGIGHDGKTVYKAMIDANSTSIDTRRVACLTANCGAGAGEAVNWVLEASREYRREDGTTVIGTTTSGGIFSFPLDNAITSTSTEVWTGMTTTWASGTNMTSAPACAYWQSQGASGTVGDASSTGTALLSSTTTLCSNTRALICVEQTRGSDVFTDYPGYN